METQNTVLSDINEIHVGYILAKKSWEKLGPYAKAQYNQRLKQAKPSEVEDAIAKSAVMAEAFLKWAKENDYKGNVRGVWWTARPGSMELAVKRSVDQKKNPTDILVQFEKGPADGFLGLSAKATQNKNDIGFKNPGIGTVDRSLGTKLTQYFLEAETKITKKMHLPETRGERKVYIRAHSGIKHHTELIGSSLMASLCDMLLKKMVTLKQKELFKYITTDWMDAEILYPPYIKVTGKGFKEPYFATVTNPVKNEKLGAMAKHKLTLEKVGNEGIGLKAGDKKIMRIRFKFESEKMASGMKLTGEPW